MDHVRDTLDYWRANGVTWLAGNSDAKLDRFAKRLGVVLPAAFREFYRSTDGTRAPGTTGADHQGYEFWQLDEIEATYPGSPWAFAFGEFLQGMGYYAIDFSGQGGAGPGAVYFLWNAPIFVAPSFGEFLDLYIKQDRSRLFPPEEA